MRPIYEPKGAAKEYGDLALNIYTGCPHGCYFCFSPNVLRKDREEFRCKVEPRANIVEETRRQIEREHITNKLIHLCFSCDPYPAGYDTSATREIIKLLKDTGNHVQILTKGEGIRDFDLLDENDWYGISYTGYPAGVLSSNLPPPTEPFSAPLIIRLETLARAHTRGIKTWVSIEPVLDASDILTYLSLNVNHIDKYMIGKLNYHPSDIDWKAFGERAERICKAERLNYYIKDSLRKEMGKR